MNTKLKQTKAEVNDIAKRLAYLIDNAVEIKLNQGADLSGRVSEFKSEINHLYIDAKTLQKEFKGEGFGFNAIEQEGYLRAMTLIKNLVNERFGE